MDALTKIVNDAVRSGDADRAIWRIQRKIGQTAGDVAGQFFDDGRLERAIAVRDAATVKALFCRYLTIERSYATGDAGVRIAAVARSCPATQWIR